MSPTRREFFRHCFASSTLLALGCTHQPFSRTIPGTLVGASFRSAHLLRGGNLPEPSQKLRTKVLIAGGGIAGLSAARALLRSGVQDVMLCELERETGGNSASGENQISAYPWGAHYVPVPNEESSLVRELFQELGLTNGANADGQPIYREEFLCHEPEERLLIHGRWQNGLVPNIGVGAEDTRQIKEFFVRMSQFRKAVGKDGKAAFAIPIDLSSTDEEIRKLDSLSFAAYLDQQGWKSVPLRWYTNYCCRDDYGTAEHLVSAWAGIHYFAGRRPFAGNTGGYELFTWPEGNGWIARHLRRAIDHVVKPRCLVYELEQDNATVSAKVFDLAEHRSFRVSADYLLYAAPRFTLPYLLHDLREKRPSYLADLQYSPWAVANVTLKNFSDLSSLAWDNVSYHSESLGYVVATHQRLERQGRDTVLTWYLPLSNRTPKEEREDAISKPLAAWQQMVVDDLKRMHPGIEAAIANIDICLWGHAMIRPSPGFLWGGSRQEMLQPLGRIHFAHSDMSGISIFEEAQYRGILAAERLAALIRT